MRAKLLWIVAVTSTCFAMSTQTLLPPKIKSQSSTNIEWIDLQSIGYVFPQSPMNIEETSAFIRSQANTLSPQVIHKVLTTLECANAYQLAYQPILTIVDYSLPSNAKRLWIFNLKTKQLLFHTYVSHGIKSGTLLTTYFSNRYNSKSSSMGVYLTEDAYRGREGISLRLTGLDAGFNDNASNRSIVMHGGWYMNDSFIKRYGRAGRSWGCPAVPLELSESIINTIKDHSLMVVYYPNDAWFERSRFLNCRKSVTPEISQKITPPPISTISPEQESRESVLFANIKMKHAETEPVVAMPANHYEAAFHTKAPLARMLRRQIDQQEYIALSTNEFNILSSSQDKQILNEIYFVIPQIKMDRGYYITEMKIVDLGKITEIQPRIDSAKPNPEPLNFTVYLNHQSPITLRASNQFIRWLGL